MSVVRRKIYSYVFQSASGDFWHIISGKNYKNVYDFMKHEAPEEYNAWKDGWDPADGPWDEEAEIDYIYYDQVAVELNGINGPLKEI